MIRYVIDSSALWRVLRDDDVRAGWADVITSGVVGSCQAQRTEFFRSARNRSEFDAMSEMFAELYPDVPMHKSSWSWINMAQHKLVSRGLHRSMSVVDLLVAAAAARHGLVVLHDDTDFVAAADVMPDLEQRSIRDLPQF